MRVFIAGGTGQIGSRLVDALLARGDQSIVLTRRPEVVRQRWGDRCGVIEGDPTQAGRWMDELDGYGYCEAAVNLAGENLFARRWSAKFKERLRSSRIDATTLVVLAQGPQPPDAPPKVLVSGSAVGIYGPHGDEELDESAPPGDDFLAQLCRDWEAATRPAAESGVRVVNLRTGIVFDPAGGALGKMLLPFRLFAGGPIGSGRHYMSWIHHADMTGLILLALDNPQVHGPLNATAPNPVTNRDFAKIAGRVLHRPSFLPTPRFALRVAAGEVTSVIATGQRVIPRQALKLGYVFRFPELEGALRDLLERAATVRAR